MGVPVNGRRPALDLRRGRLVDVRFGPPMRVATGDDLVDTTRELGARLTSMLEALEPASGAPPGHGGARTVAPRTWAGTLPTAARAMRHDHVRGRGPALPTWRGRRAGSGR